MMNDMRFIAALILAVFFGMGLLSARIFSFSIWWVVILSVILGLVLWFIVSALAERIL